jgi:hypothetical protein
MSEAFRGVHSALEKIRSSEIGHAHGAALDVPDLLVALTYLPTKTGNKAWWKLHANLWHQLFRRPLPRPFAARPFAARYAEVFRDCRECSLEPNRGISSQIRSGNAVDGKSARLQKAVTRRFVPEQWQPITKTGCVSGQLEFR